MFFYCVGTFEVLKITFFIELYLKLYKLYLTSGVLWRPLDREEGLVAMQWLFLLRKIALPYPHKCLLGFVEQKRIDRQEFFKEYSCHKR